MPNSGKQDYAIPDGNGYWMKTDPRADQDRITSINQNHNGNVLNAVRLIKFWNRRPIMPSIPSYLMECIVLDYYNSQVSQASEYVDLEVVPLLNHIEKAVLGSVYDPKGIQGDINSLSWETRWQISARASSDSLKAAAARNAENEGDHKESIRLWRQVFGPAFPAYG